jgi:glycosyltransferase involved in cell wall biosynthesis
MPRRLLVASDESHSHSWKTESDLKIAFIHNRYIDYRLPFFEKLASLLDTEFFFDQVAPKTKVQKCLFVYKVLRSVQILQTSEYDVTWSPMLLYHLLKGKYNVFIGADLGQPGTYTAFIVARMLRKPFILCNEGWYYPRTLLRSLRQPFLNIMMQESNAVVGQGKKAKEFFLRSGVDPKKIFIGPNASRLVIGKDTFSQNEKLKRKLGIENKRVVLYFGRLMERKGVAVLIKAFTKLQEKTSDSVLVIAGEGEERKKLENLCSELKVNNVIFVGYVDERDKSLYYSITDVFVLPSVAHSNEVWDLVLNEAMSLGKPVISTTAAGASYDLIKNGVNGYIVKAGDVEGLSNAIEELLENPEKTRKMGIASKRIVEKDFSYDKMVEGFVEAIKYVRTRANPLWERSTRLNVRKQEILITLGTFWG